MTSYRVDVQPSVLVWARTSIGMSTTQAAAKLGIDRLTLELWEAGAYELAQPTIVQLRRLAEVYKRPIAAFYFGEPPVESFEGLIDFRLPRKGKSRQLSPELLGNLRRVQMQRDVAIELAEDSGDSPQAIEILLHSTDNSEKSAHAIRSWLGVSRDDQLGWKNEYQALNAWIGAIERKGILVAQSSDVPLEEMRGYSIGEQPFPFIVLNGRDRPRPRIFTLMHELSHILLRASGLCDLRERARPGSDKQVIELFCNEVAAAVLLPKDQLKEALVHLGVDGPTRWSDATLGQFAHRFSVSREVFLRRMVSIGYATMDDYFRKLAQYSRQLEDQAQAAIEKRSGGPSLAAMTLRDLGPRYTSEVLDAYARQHIDASEMATYLLTKVDHFAKLEALLERRA